MDSKRPILKIRQLAASRSGRRIAAGEFERGVHILDVVSHEYICGFDTVLDAGGRRLAISADGLHCVAGAYYQKGIVCYSTDGGDMVWCRKDLKKLQWMKFSPDDTQVLLHLQDRPAHILDRYSGETILTLRGKEEIYKSEFEPICLCSSKQLELRSNDYKMITIIPRETFAELDAVFSPGRVFTSESGGPVRCFETKSGTELWRYQEEQSHALRLSYRAESESFLAVFWNYNKGGRQKLYHFDAASGRRLGLFEIGEETDTEFCLDGKYLIMRDGDLIDTLTGAIQTKLWLLP